LASETDEDPWSGAEDIAREELLEWCRDFVRLRGGSQLKAQALLLQDEERSDRELGEQSCCAGGNSERFSLGTASTTSDDQGYNSLRLPSESSSTSSSSPTSADLDTISEGKKCSFCSEDSIDERCLLGGCGAAEPRVSLPSGALRLVQPGQDLRSALRPASMTSGPSPECLPSAGLGAGRRSSCPGRFSVDAASGGANTGFPFSSALRPAGSSTAREPGEVARRHIFGSALRPCGHWPQLEEGPLAEPLRPVARDHLYVYTAR